MKALIVDLDGTLLHEEPAEIPVTGRSGYRYMSQKSADILAEISADIPVVIATGRNARSVGNLTEQLEQISFSGFILENGLIARTSIYRENEKKEDEWKDLYEMLPGWERLKGYENCLGLIFPYNVKDPKAVITHALNHLGKSAHLYQENHKLFVYPFLASKLDGIQALNFEPFIVLGDEINDMDMLRAGAYPGTLASAHEDIRQFIHETGSYCSEFSSHAGTEDLLKWAETLVS